MANSPLTALADQGNQLEARFKNLLVDTRSADFTAVVVDLRAWLGGCVAQGRFLPPGAPDRRALQGQLDYWTSLLRQVGQPCDEIDRIEAFDPQAGHVLADDLFPYHGLLAATATGKVFAGRDEQIQEYADHIDGHAALLIQSESGGGKSSVAMAGVLPELQRRHPDWWLLARVTPGTQPADTLREALGGLLSLSAVDARSVQAALGGKTVLVYVDQLEELLTMCNDVQQQQAFSELLATLAEAGVLRLVATMRVDHYERLAHSSACHRLYGLLTRDGSVKTLPPMSLAQIRSVILKPAESVGLRFVPASIVETLASETANAPSGLPLLQFALQRLWDERPRQGGQPDGPRLDMVTEASFKALPTLSKALGKVADDYFGEMERQGLVDACRRLMLELTVIDERLEVPLRRRRAEVEVLAVLINSEMTSPEQAQVLVDGLVERRLLVRTGEGAGRQIEVAHEALFRYWGRFQDWINDEDVRATLRETRQITRDALLWERAHRSADLLNLRGDPLQRARKHRRAHWLEPLVAAYVDACDEAAAESARFLASQQAAAAQAETKANAEQARAVAATTRGRQFRQRATFFGLLLLAGITYYQFRQIDELEARNTTTVSFVLPQLKPMEGLDLAYTMQDKLRTPESLATLAHAIDDTGNAVKVGARKDKAAYFTPSGQATMQLVAGPDGGFDHASVRPLGQRLTDLQAAARVPLGLVANEILASLDVGPAMAGGARLVVASFVGLKGPQGPAMTRLRVYQIDAGATDARWLQDLPFPSNVRPTRNASELAFDASGTQLAVSARLMVPSGQLRGDQIATQIVRWRLGGQVSTEEKAVGDEAAATALAFLDVPDGPLIKGRQDGRVDCGNVGLADSLDWPRVVSLKTSRGGRYAALHADNSITVGNCLTLDNLQVAPPGPAKPEQLVLRSSQTAAGVELSYSLKGKLVCQRILDQGLEGNGYTGDEEHCEGHGLFADHAVPAIDVDGRLAGYRVLDGDEPLMMFWDLGRASVGGAVSLASGLPVAGTPSEVGRLRVASSPNGQQRVAVETPDGKPVQVARLAADGSAGPAFDVQRPQLVAVNNAGVVVVMASRGAAQRHLLTAIAADGSAPSSLKTFDDAACMKLSPDGRQVLVASDQWQAKRLALNGKTLTDTAVLQRQGPGNQRLDPVTACAMGDGPDGTVVLASRDGNVRRFDPKSADWKPMSELVPFALGGPALDVSIDGGSRFVAVLSARRASRCRNGAEGHLLRIWDLRLKRPDYPVASACIGRNLRAIGALEKTADQGWVLPLYHQARAKSGLSPLLRIDFPCRACRDGQLGGEMVRRIDQNASDLGAARLDATTVANRFGIKL